MGMERGGKEERKKNLYRRESFQLPNLHQGEMNCKCPDLSIVDYQYALI